MTIAANEIRNIDAYLHIQLVMRDNSFQVIKEIQEAALSYSVPKLILQPWEMALSMVWMYRRRRKSG